jgi:nucleotide-binding universal stress UspA family protein
MTTSEQPLILGLPLDHEATDVLNVALELGRRLLCPVVVVHAIAARRFENPRSLSERMEQRKQALAPQLERLREAGLDVREVIEIASPADLLIGTAQRMQAQLTVIGGGRRATVHRWMVGSVAEAVVRRASSPVWVARERPSLGQPVLCPVDLSPPSKLGLAAAVRMAHLLGAPLLRVMMVIAESSSTDELEPDEARERVEALLKDQAIEGLDVDVVVESGVPAERIVDAAADAGLLVVGSRGFDVFAPEWLGPVTTRALRSSRASVLTVREVDIDLERRLRAINEIADAFRIAREFIADDRATEALPFIESAAERAPLNAAIQETYAIALERVGSDVKGRGRREIAKLIRTQIDRM